MNDVTAAEPVAIDVIRSRIFTIRGVQAMLAPDLAELYGVPTKVLNQAVKRNIERFPERFMFQLGKDDIANLKSQIVTSSVDTSLRSQIVTLNKKRGQHFKYLPYAFTEQGIAMLSAVLKSEAAIVVSIRIMDAFVAMRRALATVAPLLARIEATDRRQIADQLRNDANQAKNEERFKLILDAMRDKTFPPQKVFYDGQIYDAFDQMKKFLRMAKSELMTESYRERWSFRQIGRWRFCMESSRLFLAGSTTTNTSSPSQAMRRSAGGRSRARALMALAGASF